MPGWHVSARTLGASAILAIGVVSGGCERSAVAPSPVESPTQPNAAPGPPIAERSPGPLAFVSTRDGSPHIYLANADGSAATRLTPGETPAWSPDGTRIAFDRDHGLYIVNAEGSGGRFLGPGLYPDWSPDGMRIVFYYDEEIYVMNADGSGRRKLVAADLSDEVWPHSAEWPSWSPLDVIAFVRTSYLEVWQVHLVNADGSAPRHLVDGPGSSKPAWSPDGSTIAFAAWDGIRTVRVDRSGSTMRVRGEDLFSPDWTPDGGFVFSTFTAPGRTRIFIHGTGGTRHLVPDAPAPAPPDYRDYSPVWARQ